VRRERLPCIGWREHLTLPDLGVGDIKAKIDTGARSSALHAFAIAPLERGGKSWVQFQICPRQHDPNEVVSAEAELLDWRSVRSSNGERQQRPTIRTRVAAGGYCWMAEVTLTDRDEMGFRMLLGREALRDRFLVDPGQSYLLGAPDAVPNLPPR